MKVFVILCVDDDIPLGKFITQNVRTDPQEECVLYAHFMKVFCPTKLKSIQILIKTKYVLILHSILRLSLVESDIQLNDKTF